MIRVGIIGGAGYTAGELIRLLVNHPQAEIAFVHSTSNAGNRLAQVHGGLEGDTGMRFCDAYDLGAIDVLFLCSAHGQSRVWMEENSIPAGVKIIDLAQDFRDESCGFVYGLPELNRERIRRAERVANPGCFATAIQLALLPLAAAGLLQDEAHVTAVTGSTGAGVKPSATTHFSWRSDNISVYKAFTHQHLLEIGRNLRLLEPSFDREVNFVPMRGDFTRGILASVYTACPLDGEAASKLYADFYAPSAFTLRHGTRRGPQAGGQHQQGVAPHSQIRRETARRLGHRQPAERGVGTGRAEHEPDVRAGRKGGFAAESLGILIRTGVIHGVPPWFTLPFGGNRRTQHEQRPLAGYAVPEGGKRAQRS